MSSTLTWVSSHHDRHGRRIVWSLAGLVMLVACGFYGVKAAEERSAFVRWRHQVLQLWDGVNIYTDMMFPNPPIMPISLYPFMTLPPVVGAIAWFAAKVAMAAASVLLCLRMARGVAPRLPAWAEGTILLLSLRPILSDLQHGNINILILFLIVTCVYSWQSGYDVLAGLLLALAISYKVTPGLFLPYFMYKRSWRTVFATGLGMGLFLLVVPSIVLGPQFNGECIGMWWHRILSPFLTKNVATEAEINQSMVGVLNRLLTATEPMKGRYGQQIAVNVVAWDPVVVNRLMKGLMLGVVGLLGLLCRTKASRRDDPRMLGEFSLIVLAMLIISERSWKHHFVTVLLPYTYLVYRVARGTTRGERNVLIAALVASALLMATTSSEIGGLVVENGHKVAQAYGMFLWSAVVLFAATAWRVVVEGPRESEAPGTPGPVARPPHFAASPARMGSASS